uniref:Uncharacterized protein n=1 Tax=viral metagenome TaxID=1070528 RepID=A0A6C0D0Q4_9ZZZZ
MSETDILIEFKTSLINFFDELIDQFPNEGDLIVIRIFLKDQIPIKDIMDIFLLKINKDDQHLKKMVKERNESFFLDHNIFDSLGRDRINHFKKIWRSGNLDQEDKLVIWKWVDLFIHISDKYVKAKNP